MKYSRVRGSFINTFFAKLPLDFKLALRNTVVLVWNTIIDDHRQKKREAEEADKVEVAPGVTVASLRRFRTALIGPTQGLPKRRRLCR